MTHDATLSIEVPGSGAVSAVHSPSRSDAPLLIYAPGAGSSLRDPFGVYVAARLPADGVALLRFQFPYMEAGRHMPDRNPVLEATWRAAIDTGRTLAPTLVAGGRSMGGRIASQVVAQGTVAHRLVLFAYPLHAPGRPEQTRDAHLTAVPIRTLFVSGTRDAFATPAELDAVVAKMPAASLHLLEGADHGFNVVKASGRTRTDVWRETTDAFLEWLQTLSA